jgi:hypothetical protein
MPESKKYLLLLLLFMTVFVLKHHRAMELPPVSHHVWRQTFTASVAVNFYEESMNIFKPRVNHRKDTDGITGMQFPLYEWVSAALFHVFGKDESVFRWLSIILFLWTVYFFFDWLSDWLGVFPAFAGSMILLWSPELYYHSVNPLPDIMALFFAILSCRAYFHYYNTQRYALLPISFALLCLAGLIKIHFLLFGGLFFLPFWRAIRQGPVRMSHQVAYTLFTLSVVGGWYGYAVWLRSVSDLKDVGLYTTPAADLSSALTALKDVLISDLPEQLIGYASFAAVVIGVVLLFRNRGIRHFRIAFLPLAVASVIYFIFELGQFKAHSYYLIPFIPFIIIYAIKGLQFANRTQQYVILGLLFIQPVLTAIRMDHRWNESEHRLVPEAFFRFEPRAALTQSVPAGSTTLVGPDPSGCIYFYFTNTKGYCAFNLSQLDQLISESSSMDIDYIITPETINSTNVDLIEQQLGMNVYEVLD